MISADHGEIEIDGDEEEDELYEEEEYDEDYDDEGDEFVEEEEIAGPRGSQGFIRGLEPLPPRKAAGAPSPKPAQAQPWEGLQKLPDPTQRRFNALLSQLKAAHRTSLTILLLGKGGVGKSSTANSLFNEKVATVAAMQNDAARPATICRTAAGFELRVIDTPSILEGDALAEGALGAIVKEVRRHPVDVVFFLDRLDGFRVDGCDHQVLEGITRALGPWIWEHAVLGLTHGRMTALPPGYSFEAYVEERAAGLRAAVRGAGASKAVALPAVLIENSSRCETNLDGEKVLVDGTAWLPAAMEQVVAVAQGREAYIFDAKAVERSCNPNKKRRWLIPVLLLAQIAFKVFVMDRVFEEDAATGDQYGPYDPEYVRVQRRRRRQAKERRKEEAQRRRVQAQTGRRAPSSKYESETESDSDDE